MEKLKQFPAAQKRLVCILLALICMLGLLPSTLSRPARIPIVMEDCTHNGVYYESAALSTCWLHQMKFDYNGDTVMGFCADHGAAWAGHLRGMNGTIPGKLPTHREDHAGVFLCPQPRDLHGPGPRLGVDEAGAATIPGP